MCVLHYTVRSTMLFSKSQINFSVSIGPCVYNMDALVTCFCYISYFYICLDNILLHAVLFPTAEHFSLDSHYPPFDFIIMGPIVKAASKKLKRSKNPGGKKCIKTNKQKKLVLRHLSLSSTIKKIIIATIIGKKCYI